MTQKTNPWTFDVRVRDRNLKAGTITDKDVEKYVGGLPDLADQSESFGTSQPALLQPPQAEVVVDDLDDEDDEDDEQDAAEPEQEKAEQGEQGQTEASEPEATNSPE